MAKTVPDTIVLRGSGIYVEADAAATITPGHLVEYDTSGDFALGATTTVLPIFARENDIVGGEITDNYSSGGKVLGIIPQRGAMVYAILADGENVAIGADLEPAASGELQAVTSGAVVAVAAEAVDASDSAATPVASRRIKAIIV